MRRAGSFASFGGTIVAASAASYGAWKLVPLTSWAPALPGILTALSLLSGAVLVRLARNAPITSPTTFDDDDLRRFFDTLEELSRRLLWIFIQTIVAVFLVIVSIILSTPNHPSFSHYDDIARACSGFLAGLLVWLLWRLIMMARGDLGFLRLQRKILENALRRERKKEAAKIVVGSVSKISPGRFGSIAGG